MVVAHAYDLRAAKRVGMSTAYIQRSTEDLCEDTEVIRGEMDYFCDGLSRGSSPGMLQLASKLGV